MEEATRLRDEHQADAADLAAVVLGLERCKDEQQWPEHVPIDADGRGSQPGFDVRSVAILALVVAMLSGIVGWATTVGSPPDSLPRVVETDSDAAGLAGIGAETGEAVPVAASGIDLSIGRIIPTRAASGTGLVAVGVGNFGDRPYDGRPASIMLLLVDGKVVAREPIPAIAPGDSTRITVALDWCPTGSVPVTAVLDATAVVREADERNNASSRSATFGC
jgi:hypothetical protein